MWKGRITPLPRVTTGLAAVVEHLADLSGKSGHDGGVEEEIETCEDDTADYDTDDDLDSGIDIALAGGGLDSGSCGDDGGIRLVLDGVNEILHVFLPRSFFVFEFWFFFDYCRSILINLHN